MFFRLHINYHFEVEDHFYSAPHRLVREQMDVRYTETTVECLRFTTEFGAPGALPEAGETHGARHVGSDRFPIQSDAVGSGL